MLTSVAPLAGSAADRQNAWGAGGAGPVPDGLGAPALGAAGTRPQTWLVHVWGSAGERFTLPCADAAVLALAATGCWLLWRIRSAARQAASAGRQQQRPGAAQY